MLTNLCSHNFSATYQEGIISQIDPKTHKVRCVLPALDNLETAWLSYLTPNAGGNQFYCLPDVGALVAILLDARGEGGCVLGAIYNQQDPVPVADSEVFMLKFKNGTIISHNRATGDVVIDAVGTVLVKSPSLITLDCSETKTTGNLLVEGSLTYMQGMTGNGGSGGTTAVINGSLKTQGGDITADNISLKKHVHTEQGDGNDTSVAK
ncbi:phage baseplate protein [Mergibacter septicus]|uniref:Phage baseplate protein n=1 Tax=Mergibacter septicus TaxID=221402 RepID=A0A8E3S9S8_9PAST|nr:phage baseplate assembly protein V [Mergibacter septicus]AWX15240.1 phage baseplate protein [Mergibacter septicus]QDJ14494.1 phage baseplate protein [Mergibacter septicus]UTU48070.1 phage baseplate assembly protein V [Mergibacter septicus]WMR96318.1 phage baseplate assembly protein V [Mergibacter septicus]